MKGSFALVGSSYSNIKRSNSTSEVQVTKPSEPVKNFDSLRMKSPKKMRKQSSQSPAVGKKKEGGGGESTL